MPQNEPDFMASPEDAQLHFNNSPLCMSDLHNISLRRLLAEAQARIAELENVEVSDEADTDG